MQAGAQALGLTVCPVAGGPLVASAGWRWIFFINVPVGAGQWRQAGSCCRGPAIAPPARAPICQD